MLLKQRFSGPRLARIAAAAAVLWAGLGMGAVRAASAEPAPAPAADLAVCLDGSQSASAVEQAQQNLLAGDRQAAVTALAALYQSDRTDTPTRLRIIGLLGLLKTDASAAVLQKICAQSALTILDVRDWGALARAVQAGKASAGNDAVGRIWRGLSAEEQKGVEQLAAATEADAAALRGAHMLLLNGLNRLLDDDRLCAEADLARLPRSEAAQGLAARWRNRNQEGLPPEARFTASEYRQLNDYLLHGLFAAALQATFDLPAHQYESRTANAAIQQLMGMTGQPVAEAAIVGLNPDPYQARQHIDALGSIRGEAATARLFGYLVCDAVAASNRARDLLKARMEEEATAIETLTLNRVNQYLFAEGRQASLAACANRNLLEVAMALPSEATRRDILQRALGLSDTGLRAAAFAALALEPRLARFEEIRGALADRLETDTSADCAVQTLNILKLSEDPEAQPLVAKLLSHDSKEVRVQAAKAMALLTGKNLGSNPAVWKKWWDENHADAAQQ